MFTEATDHTFMIIEGMNEFLFLTQFPDENATELSRCQEILIIFRYNEICDVVFIAREAFVLIDKFPCFEIIEAEL